MALLLTLSDAHAAWAGEWNLKDKDGTYFTLSALQGKWVLVNFWATWCPPCLQEMPDLDALQQQHKDLQVIGIAVMYKSRKEVLDMVTKLSISYPSCLVTKIPLEISEVLTECRPASCIHHPANWSAITKVS